MLRTGKSQGVGGCGQETGHSEYLPQHDTVTRTSLFGHTAGANARLARKRHDQQKRIGLDIRIIDVSVDCPGGLGYRTYASW